MIEVQHAGARVVGRVLAGRSLDVELRAALSRAHELTKQERATLQDISYGTLRFLGEIDAALQQLLDREPKQDAVRELLRVALYQLIHTRAAPHAVVDHAVRASSVMGAPAAKGLVNAVLRNFLRRRDAVLAAARATEPGRYSYPQWWIDKLRSQHPERYADLLDSANGHPPLTLRVNLRRSTVAATLARLAAAGMPAQPLGGTAVILERPVPVDRIPGFAEGEVSVQDAAAQHAAPLLDPASGSRVLDACAAPGGKTSHLLEHAEIDLTALDVDAARLERVQANLERLGLSARIMRGDAARPLEWWDGAAFDAILADVPCSASGVVRRHPDIKWLRRPEDIARFAERQRAILDALWQLLRTDGKLLYVTCSVFHEENQDQIARFVERHPDARRQHLPWPPDLQCAGQILPDEQHDGFFYALVQKVGAAK